MSHKSDTEKNLPQAPTLSGPSFASHLLLLADYSILEPIEVELVDYPISVEEPQFEALVADSECEV
jgi:hypothetical protein